jgi:hypothetical protein
MQERKATCGCGLAEKVIHLPTKFSSHHSYLLVPLRTFSRRRPTAGLKSFPPCANALPVAFMTVSMTSYPITSAYFVDVNEKGIQKSESAAYFDGTVQQKTTVGVHLYYLPTCTCIGPTVLIKAKQKVDTPLPS